MTLSDRIAAAGPEQQRELIEEVWLALNPEPEHDDAPIPDLRPVPWRVWERGRQRLTAMLDAGAYESAVIAMKGDARILTVTDMGDGTWIAKLWKQPACKGSTFALALLAALVKARGGCSS